METVKWKHMSEQNFVIFSLKTILVLKVWRQTVVIFKYVCKTNLYCFHKSDISVTKPADAVKNNLYNNIFACLKLKCNTTNFLSNMITTE